MLSLLSPNRYNYIKSAVPSLASRKGVLWTPGKKELKSFRIGDLTIWYAYREDNNKLSQRSSNPTDMLTLFDAEYQMIKSSSTTVEKYLEVLGVPRVSNGSNVTRYHVPTELAPWEVDYPGYMPMDYTSPCVLAASPESPLKSKWAERLLPPDQRPRNPHGRTGLGGRGTLGKWGCNDATFYLITRPKLDQNKTQMKRYGKPLIEILLCQRNDGGFFLPGAFREPGDDRISKSFSRALGLTEHADDENADDIMHMLQNAANDIELADDGMFDERNTDNAWVSAQYRHIDLMHEHDYLYLSDRWNELVDDLNSGSVLTWVVVHRQLRLYNESHYQTIERIAHRQDACW